MLKEIIFGLVGLGGSVIVAGSTWFLCKSYYQKKADAEVESVREAFKRNRAQKEIQPEKETKIKKEDSNVPGLDTYKELLMKSKYAESEHPTEDEFKPYPIDQRQYEDANGWTKEDLRYFVEDSALVTMANELISIEETIGTECLLRFGLYSDDPDFTYARNPVTHTDYQIERLHSAFEDEIPDIYYGS